MYAIRSYYAIAEESGLIMAIGEWVMEEAIRQFSLWQNDPDTVVELEKIAINVSSRQFNSPDFVADVTRLLEKYSVAPRHIELELTESVIVSDIEEVSSKMLQLRDMGIRITSYNVCYTKLLRWRAPRRRSEV